VLLEAMTYRFVGHSMGDPERYRSKAEIEEWRSRDPILRLAGKMTEMGIFTEKDAEKIAKSVEEELVEIVKFAEESPEPDDAALCEHVFVNPMGHQ